MTVSLPQWRPATPSPALSGISGYIRYLLMKYDDGTAVSDAIYRFIEAGGK